MGGNHIFMYIQSQSWQTAIATRYIAPQQTANQPNREAKKNTKKHIHNLSSKIAEWHHPSSVPFALLLFFRSSPCSPVSNAFLWVFFRDFYASVLVLICVTLMSGMEFIARFDGNKWLPVRHINGDIWIRASEIWPEMDDKLWKIYFSLNEYRFVFLFNKWQTHASVENNRLFLSVFFLFIYLTSQ